jgi:hypothetical protein
VVLADETPVLPAEQVTLTAARATPRPVASPAVEARAPVAATSAVPTFDIGELQVASSSSTPTYDSSGPSRQTVGWSGPPAMDVPYTQTHRRQILQGMQAMDRIFPGLRDKLDTVLHAPADPKLCDAQTRLLDEQSQLYAQHARILGVPDNKLPEHVRKSKAEVSARLDQIQAAYDKNDEALAARTRDNTTQARQGGAVFLQRLRKSGQVHDVSDRVHIDSSARDQVGKGNPSETELKKWVNEFHHQTGLPAPSQLNFRHTGPRADYDFQADAVNIGDRFSKRLALHELAHRAEKGNPEIAQANRDWVRARCQNGGFSDEPVKLSTLVPKGDYQDDEVALEDSFADPYIGKQYNYGATEVLSVGLDHFASPERFIKLYQQDPEHVFLTLGALEKMGATKW